MAPSSFIDLMDPSISSYFIIILIIEHISLFLIQLKYLFNVGKW